MIASHLRAACRNNSFLVFRDVADENEIDIEGKVIRAVFIVIRAVFIVIRAVFIVIRPFSLLSGTFPLISGPFPLFSGPFPPLSGPFPPFSGPFPSSPPHPARVIRQIRNANTRNRSRQNAPVEFTRIFCDMTILSGLFIFQSR